jgi:hypothetical protein
LISKCFDKISGKNYLIKKHPLNKFNFSQGVLILKKQLKDESFYKNPRVYIVGATNSDRICRHNNGNWNA